MISPNGSTTLFCLDVAGNFHRLDTTVSPLGPRSDLLMMAAANEGRVFPNVAKIGELPVHLLAAANVAVAVVLPFIRIRTFFLASGTGKDLCVVPWFTSENAIDFAVDWIPADNCKVVFVYSAGVCYIVLVGTDGVGKKTIHKVPLPNIYEDGHICMGTWVNPSSGSPAVTLAEILASALTFFATSVFNADLIAHSRAIAGQLMRFTIDGKQLPPTADWRSLCSVISHASYNWVVNLDETTGVPVKKVVAS